MRIIQGLWACVAAGLPGVAAAAEEIAPGTTDAVLTLEQQEALQKGTALFIVTLLLLLAMLVAVVIATVMLRRSMAALEPREKPAPTDSESLWWNSGDTESKKKS